VAGFSMKVNNSTIGFITYSPLMSPEFMASNDKGGSPSRDLSLVNTIGKDCHIYRETSGRYVVSDFHPGHHREVATLACAYATCRSWENDPRLPWPNGGSDPSH
jgi:hypothetical protein